jgi:Zn-dependent protease with chaperone function
VYIFCNVFINNPSFYAAFGFPTSQPKVVGYVLYVLILGPIKTIFGLLDKIWSRRMEMQADEFAKKRGYATDLASCLLKLTKTNLSLIDVDWLFAVCKLNQPHLMERIRAFGWKRPDKEESKVAESSGI